MFHKIARASSLGVLTYDAEADGFRRTAAEVGGLSDGGDAGSSAAIRSYYADGARALPVRDLLARVAGLYAISDDPSNFFFEAIRANTTNCPNENNDAFHQAELLRHDVRLRIPVYYTYAGKPHHLNHKTDNPKEARGVIIDAAYNADTPALEACPACRTRTAERKNRDETGLHCRKCGTMVKDEFVEILVAIDAKKDPLFADYVRKGVLKSGSMGCNCLSTSCNVCGHVAYSKPEFCEHIRGGNKGTLWKRSAKGWTKVGKEEVGRELGKARVAFVPDDFCYVKSDGFEVRKAFEYCNQVIFDEYSRVDQPADPKANQVEVLNLRAASRTASTTHAMPSAQALATETEALARAATRRKKEFDVHMRVAQATTPPGLEPEPGPPGAPPGVPPGPGGPPMGGPAPGPGGAPQPAMMGPASGTPPGVTELHPGGPVLIDPTPDQGPGMDMGMPGGPGGMGPGGPTSIEDYTENETAPGGPGGEPGGEGEPMDMGEMGVMDLNVPGADAPPGTPRTRPPGASAPPRAARRNMQYKNAYGDWTVQISEQGNVRLLDGGREPVLVIRAQGQAAGPDADVDARRAFAVQVMQDVLEGGLVRTAKKYQAGFAPKFAQVVSGGMNDMVNFKDHELHPTVLDGGLSQTDMADQLRTDGGPETTRTDAVDGTDMEPKVRGNPPDATGEDGLLDHEKKIKDITNTTSDARMDMRDNGKRKPFSMGKDNVLQDEVHDFAMSKTKKAGAARTMPSFVPPGEGVGATAAVQAEMLRKWKSHEESPQVRFAGGTCAAVGCKMAAADGGYCSKHGADKHAGGDEDKDEKKDEWEKPWEKKDAASASDVAKRTAERLEKFAAARVARAKAEADAQVQAAQTAAVDSFVRALRVVAARTAADLEQAPLKLAAEAVLSEPREIGRDAASGEAIVYRGLDGELTRYLVAQLYEIGHADHVDMLTKRARELMAKGDEYLIDAEADLRNVRASLPVITQARTAEVDEPGLRAAELRQAAARGNLAFTPAPAELPADAVGGRRAAIQEALGGTVVAGQRGRLGLH